MTLCSKKTWELIPPDPRRNIVDNKWIFRIKQKADGSIDRYKAQLVATGLTQRPGVDFHSTFSPVVKPTIVRIVLSLATCCGWPLHQLDVNNAFLQGHLEEDVYMKQPKGFEHPDYPNYICRLQKAIYVLNQAPRVWYNELKDFLVSLGFKNSQYDSSMLSFTQWV